eukprot:gene16815-biopygen4191
MEEVWGKYGMTPTAAGTESGTSMGKYGEVWNIMGKHAIVREWSTRQWRQFSASTRHGLRRPPLLPAALVEPARPVELAQLAALVQRASVAISYTCPLNRLTRGSPPGGPSAGAAIGWPRCRGTATSSAAGLVKRAGGMLDRAGGMLDRAGGLLDRAGGLLDRAGGLLHRAGGLLNMAGTVSTNVHRIVGTTGFVTDPGPALTDSVTDAAESHNCNVNMVGTVPGFPVYSGGHHGAGSPGACRVRSNFRVHAPGWAPHKGGCSDPGSGSGPECLCPEAGGTVGVGAAAAAGQREAGLRMPFSASPSARPPLLGAGLPSPPPDSGSAAPRRRLALEGLVDGGGAAGAPPRRRARKRRAAGLIARAARRHSRTPPSQSDAAVTVGRRRHSRTPPSQSDAAEH